MTTKHTGLDSNGSPKILIPVGELVSKERIAQALHVLSSFKKPMIVLFHVIEVPSRTATLEPDPYHHEIKEAERKLSGLSKWLTDQGMKVTLKVVVARNVAEGIIDETESDGYLVVFMMKRGAKRGWRRLFARSVSQRVVRSANCLVMTAPLERLMLRRSGKH